MSLSNPAPAPQPSQSSPTTAKILAVLSNHERTLFFKSDPFETLAHLNCEIVSVESETLATENWKALLDRERPTILLAAWSTPDLPTDLPVDERGLAYVCYLTGSVRGIVTREMIERGLIVSNWGGCISRTIAENALMLTLMGLRRTAHWHEKMHHQAGWNHQFCDPNQLSLFKRRVGLHGFGRIAQELVQLLRPFQPVISAYSPRDSDELLEAHGVHRCESLDELFAHNHVVIELAALNDATFHSVGQKQLELMPENAVFVNVGRGAVVDEEALIRVVAKGRIRVALDVFETEPLKSDSPLREMTDVILMPHQSGPTHDHGPVLGEFALSNIERFLTGKPIEALITANAYDQQT